MYSRNNTTSTESLSLPLLKPVDDEEDLYSAVEHGHAGACPAEGVHQTKQTARTYLASCAIICAFLISILSMMVNISTLRAFQSSPTFTIEEIIFPSQQRLKYGNSYFGLESAILQDPTPFPPVTNFPLYLGQVNSSDPSAVYLDQHRWASGFGMVYQEDRRFLVNSLASTVAQFRTLDFGMERCKLMLTIPSPDDLGTSEVKKAVTTNRREFSLDIWHLQGDEVINPRSLSWSSKPGRATLLTSLQILPDTGAQFESPEFRCVAGSLQTFEMSCQSSECLLEFQQDTKLPRLALYILQHQSIMPEIL